LRILWDTKDRPEKIQNFRNLASGFLHQLLEKEPPNFEESEADQKIINNLALLLAHGRGVINTKKSEYTNDENKLITFYEVEEVQIEEPFRAALQLRTLARALAWIHGRNSLTFHELELLRRVVLSTMPVDRASVLGLFPEPRNLADMALTRELCAKGIGKSYGRANQLLTELTHVGLLTLTQGNKESGQPHTYRPKTEFDRLIYPPVLPLDHIADLIDTADKDKKENVEPDLTTSESFGEVGDALI
jgi:hypothetical protein